MASGSIRGIASIGVMLRLVRKATAPPTKAQEDGTLAPHRRAAFTHQEFFTCEQVRAPPIHEVRPAVPNTPDDIPSGLVFFTDQASPSRRRRRRLFLALVLVATLALIAPVYPLFGSIRPLILGLPLSFAWVVLWLTVVFLALVWLYRSDG
jgi:hypothetical protein